MASLQSAISRRNKVEIETPPTTQVQRHRPVEGVSSIQAPAQYQQGGGGSDSESDDADLDSDGGADDVKTCTLINQISSVKTCSFVRRRIRMSYPGTSTYLFVRYSHVHTHKIHWTGLVETLPSKNTTRHHISWNKVKLTYPSESQSVALDMKTKSRSCNPGMPGVSSTTEIGWHRSSSSIVVAAAS